MKCPYCSADHDRVIDSRPSDDNASIRRRRECLSCNRRFTTYEKVETAPLMVIKKDGSRQPFDRNKLSTGILKSLVKRPVSLGQVEKMIDAIENRPKNQLAREISTRAIGEAVLEELRKVDQVAYIRFMSVYREFEDVDSFLRELSRLSGADDTAAKSRDGEGEGG
jgi:transcriptional repressor NrdR